MSLKNKEKIFIIVGVITMLFFLDLKWFGEKVYNLLQVYEDVILPLYFGIIDKIKNHGNVLYKVFKCFAVLILVFYLCDIYPTIKKDIIRTKNINKSAKIKYLLKVIYRMLIKLIKILTAQLFFIYTIIYTYGKASTGHDIDKLNGIAFENAVIAYFGGGSLKDGGGGKEVGYKVILLIFIYLILSKYIFNKIKRAVLCIKSYLVKHFKGKKVYKQL